MELKRFAAATLACGTLDILSAFAFAGLAGVAPMEVLRSVASGPFGDEMSRSGLSGAVLGAITHYAIMAVMVGAFMIAMSVWPRLGRGPILTGVVYGVILYVIMYWIVLPLRWPSVFPQLGWWRVGNALFSHICCVGIPMALMIAPRANPSDQHQNVGSGASSHVVARSD